MENRVQDLIYWASVLIKNNSLKESNTFDLILEQYFNFIS